ncbi:MAG TPA: adenylate/guanylate cyclase domain-containing protein [Thermoleophilaceae bacterium]
MERAYEWLYRRTGRRYLDVIGVIDFLSAGVISLGTLGILRLYIHMSDAQFLRIMIVSDLCILVALALGMWTLREDARRLRHWMAGEREGVDVTEVWRAAVGLPFQVVRQGDKRGILLVAIPVSAFATAELGLPVYSFIFLLLGALVAIAYSAILHFFAGEIALRPVVCELADSLPEAHAPGSVGVPLRWKLLGSVPLINVVTGVVVSGLSAGDRATIAGLGLSVVVAVVVAFTISLELTVLMARSVLRPVRDLIEATERVKAGDYSVRVPVISGDELGTLAQSFNQMMRGLSEREALHEAFASYVDPQVARRVLDEGTRIDGEETEVTIVFVDIRGFTTFAEHASAREAVAYVNDFLELVVPIVTRHGGHANKFVGDGLLAVFGAPARLPDHADHAVAAAAEMAGAVAERFGDRLRIGVGVSSGPVLAGTVGGGGKLDFTVIGDPVNVAARVEEVTRVTGDTVLVTEATQALLSDSAPPLEERGAIPLKGRRDPVRIYAVVDVAAEMVQTRTGAKSGTRSGR